MIQMEIIPVTEENRIEAEKLRVFPEQKNYIETVEECMQEADELDAWRPVCMMADGVPAGFAMYGCIQEEKYTRVWFDRLLIDWRFQGKGLGRRAMGMIIDRLNREYPGQDIYLSVYEDNVHAIRMYESFGFSFTGELDFHGEKVMMKRAE